MDNFFVSNTVVPIFNLDWFLLVIILMIDTPKWV